MNPRLELSQKYTKLRSSSFRLCAIPLVCASAEKSFHGKLSMLLHRMQKNTMCSSLRLQNSDYPDAYFPRHRSVETVEKLVTLLKITPSSKCLLPHYSRSLKDCVRLEHTTRVLRTHGCSSYEYSSMGGGRLAMSPGSLFTSITLKAYVYNPLLYNRPRIPSHRRYVMACTSSYFPFEPRYRAPCRIGL